MPTPTIQEFIAQGPDMIGLRVLWCRHTKYKVYLRRAPRLIDGERLWCVDIANIESKKPGRGQCLTFFNEVEELAKVNQYEAVFVECVQNVRFRGWLLRHGYTLDQRSDKQTPSYWKKVVNA